MQKTSTRPARLKKLADCKKIVGESCKICGYDRCQQALELHHKNPKDKSFDISDAIYQKIKVTDRQIKNELKKCVLVCANCHRELHYGLIHL